MGAFTTLVGRLFLIAIFMMIMEFFFEDEKYKTLLRILRIACALGSLSLLIEFAFMHIFETISTFIDFTF